MYTSSVARAYLRPFRGLDGAGEGGKLCPSRSNFEKAFEKLLGLSASDSRLGGLRSDISETGKCKGWQRVKGRAWAIAGKNLQVAR